MSTAMRQTSTGWLWKWMFYTPMMVIGIPAEVFITVGGINLVYQYWVHTEHVPKLGWLEKIFITPSNHRVHQCLLKNQKPQKKRYKNRYIFDPTTGHSRKKKCYIN